MSDECGGSVLVFHEHASHHRSNVDDGGTVMVVAAAPVIPRDNTPIATHMVVCKCSKWQKEQRETQQYPACRA
jgi:hypothetical protein